MEYYCHGGHYLFFITLLKVQNSESTNMNIMKKKLKTKCVWERKFQQNFTKESTPAYINCRFICKMKGKDIQYMSTKLFQNSNQ